MRRYNILVTAVGAIVGYGIIASLRQSGFDVHIIGCDIFEDAVGQYFADEFIAAVPAADENYPCFLKKLIDEKKIDLVLFGIEQEISAVYSRMDEFGGYEGKLVINNPDILPLCDDKWLTFRWLKDNGLGQYAIDSVISGEYEELSERFGLPFLIKPRISRAGKGIASISSGDDFSFYRRKAGNGFMAQRIVGDISHEYTVGVFGLGDGSFVNEIILRRTLSQEGATAKAWVTEDAGIQIAVDEITKKLKPLGPTNYQFRRQDERIYLLEINPRISSSTSIRSAFLYNEAKMCIEYYLEGRIPEISTVKKGKAIRYISDMVFEL